MKQTFDFSSLTDADLIERFHAIAAEITGLLPVEKKAETELLSEQTAEARDRLKSVRETVRRAHSEWYRVQREMSQRLGRRLKAARLERGLTVSDVARIARCSVGFVTWMEHGKHPLPTPDFFAAVCSEQGLAPPFESPMAGLFGPFLREA